EQATEEEFRARAGAEVHGVRVVATSFGVLFLAEWGDLSQLLTAGLAARYEDPVSVFTGSWLALVVVAGLAVGLGRTLLRYVRLSTIRRVGATVCLVLALIAAYDVVRSLT
ncbi:MAG: TMEM165/GDT1 family protein, partial [Spirochaetaceae bacterium]|nr:TMEM165/GDT1 family protein [Spirochaetaceae bacterium]